MAGPSDTEPRSEREIRQATAGDLAVAKAWLAAAGLPTADLSAAHMSDFLVAMEADRPVGMIGLEDFSDCGLLRSLIVDAGRRGTGLGAELVAALEALAASRGLRALWLLTIDADRFFVRLGYMICQREDAPKPVQASAEFSTLCPGDAVLMCKQLAAGQR